MSIAQSENLKRELTDKYVVVQDGVPELRRFSGLTGQVKTVNMNCRALVQFDGPVDISWYDIDPSFLKVVTAPLPKAEKHVEKPAAEAKPVAAAKPVESSEGKKLSPLEMARQQGAGGAAGKKLSPLEIARQQGAAGKPAAAAPTPSSAPVAEIISPAPVTEAPASPPPAPTPEANKAAPAKPMSVAEMLAMARKQGAPKQ